MFTLATKCYIIDITNEKNRTGRLAMTDAFLGIGYLIGLPLGTRLKKEFGYVPLFTTSLCLCALAILYIAIFIRDSYDLMPEERRKAFDQARSEITNNSGKGEKSDILTMTKIQKLRKCGKDDGNDSEQHKNSGEKEEA